MRPDRRAAKPLDGPSYSVASTAPGQVPTTHDIDRISKFAPDKLVGREKERKLLTSAWKKVARGDNPRPRVLTFVALGGEGKTSLVAKWTVDELLAKGWPGCDAAFAWSFYSQGTREQVAASSDIFLRDALTFFGSADDKAFAESAAGAHEKGQRLARVVGAKRALLILDGLEPLQYAPTSPTPGELKDAGILALLRGLAQSSNGLVLVTTRYSIPDLKAFWGSNAPEKPLVRLSTPAGVHLLHTLGVREESGSAEEFETLVEDVKGHALTLNLLGTYLRDAHGGDVRKRDLVDLDEANTEEQGGHAFRVMAAYEQEFVRAGDAALRPLAVLRLVGLFDRPMSADCYTALLQKPAIAGLTDPLVGASEAERNLALKRLEDARLLTVNRTRPGALVSLDAHPLTREYFAKRFREQHPDAWREAHRRLYEHLCVTTKEGDEPTLEGLQPLFQAVAHGCHAGLQQKAFDEVYMRRINKDLGNDEFYCTKKLGAFGSDLGAVAWFYESPWDRLSASLKEEAQAWLMTQAAYRLRVLGRLNESLGPAQAGLEKYLRLGDWKNSAIGAGNLSDLNLMLGEVDGAIKDAERAVSFAVQSGDRFQQMTKLATLADALHQTVRREEANARFCEAEDLQAKPPLFSLRGFCYCDLLLAPAECAAWANVIGNAWLQLGHAAVPVAIGKRVKGRPSVQDCIALCRKVTDRARRIREIAEGDKLLRDIALGSLMLGQATFYEAILTKSPLEVCRASVEDAVSGLRRAGAQFMLPHGLLTRAWLAAHTGTLTGPDSAQEDLDEAWEIAVRGPMKLFITDIHMYRARLFYRAPAYPLEWGSAAADLAAAEKLIRDCGYHRRDEELADAKHAILGTK